MVLPPLYDIQKQFIKDCKSVFKNSEVGIFSSPTGTGKTLSLLLSLSDLISENESTNINFLCGSMIKTKIYFCSRTHSQLNQCINEFKRLNFKKNSCIMGSRKIYCVNKDINNKESIEKVNNKCQDLINTENCKFYGNDIFEDGIFDIEELVKKGKKFNACPYFFIKKYFKNCEIVFLPYNLLFNDEARESYGIKLKNSIVIIDEAHNIIECVNSINTKIVFFELLEKYNFFINKMLKHKLKNKYLDLIILIFEKLIKYKNEIYKHNRILNVNDFLFEADLANFNMLEIEENLKSNKTLNKIDNCTKNLNGNIFEIIKFLTLLVNSDKNCKIEISNLFIKIFPIDSKIYFNPFLECKSIVFAGGTMEPINQLINIFETRIVKNFSYNSICTKFQGFIIHKINNYLFELTEKTRDTEEIKSHIKFIIDTFIKKIIKGGIVIFLPSKYILEKIFNLFKNEYKNLFFENKNTFKEYQDALHYNAAILFAVMGGRFSEGINFSDNLCRILVILGIPFPNLTCELEEKIRYFGQDFYLQTAMKTVNQTIGRALRHKEDFASIFLIDNRYNKYKNEISSWMKKKLYNENFDDAVNLAKQFLKINDC